MKSTVFAAAALVLGASVAFAQDSNEQQATQQVAAAPADQAAPAPVPAEDDPLQETVCRTERITGSLTRRRRTCMTRAEWNAIEASTQEELRRQTRQASGGTACRQDQMAQGGC